MRIGLDARTLYSRQARGTGRNLRDLLRVLAPATPRDEYLLYRRSSCTESGGFSDDRDFASAENVVARPIDLAGDRLDLWFNLRLPIAARADSVDVLHAPANAAPGFCTVPTVVTIHDLIPLDPHCPAPPLEARRFERRVRHALRVAARIVTPSHYTRSRLVSEFSADPDRIAVVPWAPDTRLTQPVTSADAAACHTAIRDRFELTAPWILNFSGQSPRKNAGGLIRAFAALPGRIRNETLLVLSGCEPASTRDRITALARDLGVADRCRLLGFQFDQEAAALLNGAVGLAMPSLSEGFGLPVLDAMACGVPILAADNTSLPEVSADAAVYVNPTEIESIRDGLIRLLDPSDRAERIGRGRARAMTFTWQRTAALLHDVYDRCAQRRVSVRRKLRAARIAEGVQ